jgi:DNA-binding transcriptional MerR regulator
VTLASLADAANVSPRTVRYYITRGLLKPPSTGGGGAEYGPEHLNALQAIRSLQAQHLPLAEIRVRLAQEPEASPSPSTSASSALDYITGALGGFGTSAPPSFVADSGSAPYGRQGSAPTRSTWERHTVAPDVEIHVRRPLSREANRKLDRLLAQALAIFKESP